MSDIEARLASLEAKVERLEGKRPGRKGLPVRVSEDDVCGVDPERNSAVCQDATLYRRQMGCKGIACKKAASVYWAGYRAQRAVE